MPKYVWSTPPTEHTPFYIRKNPYRRSAVCFHCRTTVNMYQDAAGVDVFREHYDVDRGNGYGGRGAGRAMGRGRVIGPNQELEVCIGSDYAPIPLAYKFEDGSPIPYH
jgi:hypothetical protein